MKQKNILVLTAVTCAVIGTGTILFNVAAEAAMKDRMGQMETVPTSYQISDSLAAPLPEQETKEEGNTEVNYHIYISAFQIHPKNIPQILHTRCSCLLHR